ncbi:winged helix DNA-binding domain-containing protein [Stackebrandtia nassauensis]|uniref:Winged helix DNA-binding domain-containing protein n=1 Tax=Stackebrandtia nassauensis (strain DSM 44728 / CIP 108903 / NRRL B-16338 / NBRC 102104 / LLR-40K-21) TaxID=446470 RepID=D3Q7N6_STANL|nr:winged helix DNA-binding domain-containing protein [Stackebrandtia nassauensis]ADD44378.1 conserved hypothetical protein [Stackebrandtia nassauensis DSM 44728]
MTATLSTRTLNRTLLHRQHLTQRTGASALEVLKHLVAVQGQEPNWPYVGLWTRITDFKKDELTELLETNAVVRSTVIRVTQHLVAAEDIGWLRPTVQPKVVRHLKAAHYANEIEGIDHDELAAAGREILSGGRMPRKEFIEKLSQRFPGHHPGRLADSVEVLHALVPAPSAAVWGSWRARLKREVSLAEHVTGRPMEPANVERMIRRYLAAFGPASVMDMQAWSGLTKLRDEVERLRPQLTVYRGEDGRELFDLPGAPIVDGSEPVPVRFLPAYDNALLAYKDRTRIMSESDRKRVTPGGALVLPTFLVDGFVAGLWSVEGSTLTISPFRELSAADEAALAAEAAELYDFIAPDAPERDIRWEPAG